MNTVTTFVNPPIPVRDFDWSATLEGYEGGDPIAYGRTEQAAIYALQAFVPTEPVAFRVREVLRGLVNGQQQFGAWMYFDGKPDDEEPLIAEEMQLLFAYETVGPK
jgi:hypothetical protein